jgi:glyceraldehyde 3-phosphate dehydrogenase (phosphorylating)
MAKTRVGINGFGRIGRNFFRAAMKRDASFEIVAFNDLGNAQTMAHLLKYDSNLGPLEGDVTLDGDVVKAGGTEMRVLAERDPAQLPWADLGVEIAIESTGFFTKRDGAQKHLDAGAKKVVISAPATDPDIQRLLHHELHRADGEGAARRGRDRARVHDHHPRVHE